MPAIVPRTPAARAAGARLRRYVENLAAEKGITTTAELARASGVGRDTLHVWYRGERTPTPRGAGQLARFLGVEYGELLNAWEGTTRRGVRLSDDEVEQYVRALLPPLIEAARADLQPWLETEVRRLLADRRRRGKGPEGAS